MNPFSSNIQNPTRIALMLVWLAPLLIMGSIIVACQGLSNQADNRTISSGEITYRISFPEVTDQSITASLLPDKMTYAFTKDGFSSHFESAGGVFQNRIVANRPKRELSHQLKVFRKKVEVKMDENSVIKMLTSYPRAHVIETEGVDTIAGYPCKKALIVFEDVDKGEMEVYYTDRIQMDNPNWCTQYHDIKGVLMAYEIEEFGVRMRLRAESVSSTPPDDEQLSPEPDYDLITKDVMDFEVAQLVQTFEL